MTLQAIETRGANILAAINMAKSNFGSAAVEHAVERSIGPTIGPQAENRLVSLAWYPARLYATFLDELLQAAPALGLRAMEALGYDLVSRDFAGPYGVIARVFTPNMLLSWGPRAFARYYRGGDMVVTNVGPGVSETKFSGWNGFNVPLWETIRGGIRAAISACGKPVTVTKREGPESAVLFDIAWKA